MTMSTKPRIIHRETYQNANQVVEVLVRTKPKKVVEPHPAALNAGQKFKRDCILQKQLQLMSERTSAPKSYHAKSKSTNKNISRKLHVEMSKRKRHQVLSPNQTWSELLKSCSSIQDESGSVFNETQSSLAKDIHAAKHTASDRNDFKKDSSAQTSQFRRSFEFYHDSSTPLIDRPSFSDKETTVNLNIQKLNEDFKMLALKQNELLKQQQFLRPQYGANQINAYEKNRKDDVKTVKANGMANRIVSAESERLPSDGLSNTPFSESALILLKQLQQKLQLKGDCESSNMLGALEQLLTSGYNRVPGNGHLQLSPDPSVYNTVFQTPVSEHEQVTGYVDGQNGDVDGDNFRAFNAVPKPVTSKMTDMRVEKQNSNEVDALKKQLSEQAQMFAELQALSSRLLQQIAQDRKQDHEDVQPHVQATPAAGNATSSAIPTRSLLPPVLEVSHENASDETDKRQALARGSSPRLSSSHHVDNHVTSPPQKLVRDPSGDVLNRNLYRATESIPAAASDARVVASLPNCSELIYVPDRRGARPKQKTNVSYQNAALSREDSKLAQHPLTSTRKIVKIGSSDSDKDSAFDEKTSSHCGSKRTSPDVHNLVPPGTLNFGLSANLPVPQPTHFNVIDTHNFNGKSNRELDVIAETCNLNTLPTSIAVDTDLWRTDNRQRRTGAMSTWQHEATTEQMTTSVVRPNLYSEGMSTSQELSEHSLDKKSDSSITHEYREKAVDIEVLNYDSGEAPNSSIIMPKNITLQDVSALSSNESSQVGENSSKSCKSVFTSISDTSAASLVDSRKLYSPMKSISGSSSKSEEMPPNLSELLSRKPQRFGSCSTPMESTRLQTDPCTVTASLIVASSDFSDS